MPEHFLALCANPLRKLLILRGGDSHFMPELTLTVAGSVIRLCALSVIEGVLRSGLAVLTPHLRRQELLGLSPRKSAAPQGRAGNND